MRRICLFIKDLRGGGAEKVAVNLARGLRDEGYEVDLLLLKAEGPLLQQIPSGLNVVKIGKKRLCFIIPWLVNYITRERIDVVISFLPFTNLLSIAAKFFIRRKVRFIITEHLSLQYRQAAAYPIINHIIKKIVYLATIPYVFADTIVAVSEGLADELKKRFPSKKANIFVIYNPAVTPEVFAKAEEQPDHPWFGQGIPIIIGIGSLIPLKDFAALINAFAKFRAKNEARLIILGDGPLRQELLDQAKCLGIADAVLLPGYVGNPYKYLARSSVLVHPSRCETFTNVIAEALALGVPVVATDCPYGPREILIDGRYGKLVKTGNSDEMSQAIETALKNPPDKKDLLKRTQDFSLKKITAAYIELFNKI